MHSSGRFNEGQTYYYYYGDSHVHMIFWDGWGRGKGAGRIYHPDSGKMNIVASL